MEVTALRGLTGRMDLENRILVSCIWGRRRAVEMASKFLGRAYVVLQARAGEIRVIYR